MAFEIERKFLVNQALWRALEKPVPLHIVQGYIFDAGPKCCRIRVTDFKEAVLNIKQEIDAIRRHEFETIIPINDAQMLLKEMGESFVEKYRYMIPSGASVWEVDEFGGANKGLVVAEIELPSANATFAMPNWVGDEVTFDNRYLNTNLAKYPFQLWA